MTYQKKTHVKDTTLAQKYLDTILDRSKIYKKMGETSFLRLTNEQIHQKFSEEDNSIAVIVKHLSGNLLSRWTSFRSTDGEKPWRNRDSEFEDSIKDKEALKSIWDHGWSCFLDAISSLQADELLDTIEIRKKAHSILEAIERAVQHNAYHVGQIVYLSKSILGEKWESLSIPKNKSKEFNKKMGM